MPRCCIYSKPEGGRADDAGDGTSSTKGWPKDVTDVCHVQSHDHYLGKSDTLAQRCKGTRRADRMVSRRRIPHAVAMIHLRAIPTVWYPNTYENEKSYFMGISKADSILVLSCAVDISLQIRSNQVPHSLDIVTAHHAHHRLYRVSSQRLPSCLASGS